MMVALAMAMPVLAKQPLKKVKPMESQSGVVSSASSTQTQVKFVRRQATIQGELKSVSGTTLPATLVVSVNKVAPKKNKQWTGVYPEVKKEITVLVDANTKFVRKYWGKSSLEELTVGDKLEVRVKTNEDGTVIATLVKDDTLHWTWKVHNGRISNLDATAQTFTLTQNNKKIVTVKVDAKTKILVPPYSSTSSTFADLKNDQIAHVRGIINTKTKVITASLIRISVPKVEAVTTSTASTVTTTQ
jgi:hypothetical protein